MSVGSLVFLDVFRHWPDLSGPLVSVDAFFESIVGSVVQSDKPPCIILDDLSSLLSSGAFTLEETLLLIRRLRAWTGAARF